MGAALLMAHEDVLQPATGFCLVQFVIDGQDRAAGIAKDVAHSMAMQGIHQGIAAVYSLRSKSFRNSVITTGCGGSGLGRRGEGRQRHGCCRPINLALTDYGNPSCRRRFRGNCPPGLLAPAGCHSSQDLGRV